MSKNFWHDIESGSDIPEIINVIVEIPKGSMNKYEYDKKHNMIKLDRVLFSPFHYPGDYGLVPQTLSEDGDPLDALVLVTNPTYPGILIEARPIGLLQMKDDGDPDDKIICVSTNDPRYTYSRHFRYRGSLSFRDCTFFSSIQRVGRKESGNFRMEIIKRGKNGNC